MRESVLVAALLTALATLTGCASEAPSTLDPAGPKADFAASAWWMLFAVAAVVCVVVIALAVLAPVFRRRAKKVSDSELRGFVLAFGVAVPSVVFAAVFALSVVGLARDSDADAAAGDVTVEVIGHQWWWEVRYPGTGAVTANEIHIPVDTPVTLRLQSAEFIHSFWVPELMPKMDLLPDRLNETWFTADEVGTYLGRCAEYCGTQHTHMEFTVVAMEREEFDLWLLEMASEADEPTTALELRGREVFLTTTCATCHSVRGTGADSDFGPDLTHVAARNFLGAGAIPNTEGHMHGWVANSQTIKPGNYMPPQKLAPDELNAVVAYLQSLD